MILINHASVPIRKEKLSPTNKARREASCNEFVEKGRVPDRVKSFQEINSRENCSRVWPGFVKPIQDGLRTKQNLIESRMSSAETGLVRERMELDSRKKSRQDSMMLSKSFETQEVREIGRKEAGESRGFPILWIGIVEDVFQMEGKECKVQERLKI